MGYFLVIHPFWINRNNTNACLAFSGLDGVDISQTTRRYVDMGQNLDKQQNECWRDNNKHYNRPCSGAIFGELSETSFQCGRKSRNMDSCLILELLYCGLARYICIYNTIVCFMLIEHWTIEKPTRLDMVRIECNQILCFKGVVFSISWTINTIPIKWYVKMLVTIIPRWGFRCWAGGWVPGALATLEGNRWNRCKIWMFSICVNTRWINQL